MKANNQEKASLPENKQNQQIDHFRRAITKIGVISPVAMTLASKAALGDVYQCTISGMQSGNASSHDSDNMSDCPQGFSTFDWLDFESRDAVSGAVPNARHWAEAGVSPIYIEYKTNNKRYWYIKGTLNSLSCSGVLEYANRDSIPYKMCAALREGLGGGYPATTKVCAGNKNYLTIIDETTFEEVFGAPPTSSSGTTFREVLAGSNNLDQNACVCYLNAAINQIEFVTKDDIVALWNLAALGTPFQDGSLLVTNSSGAVALLAAWAS
ncbi:hypothetical protein [Methylomonas sp. MgM2]